MDAPPLTPAPENASGEPSSLADRLVNVIVAPGETFNDIKDKPVNHLNWFIPLLLVSAAGIFYACMAFSVPGVMQGFENAQRHAIDAQVAAGKLTQDQADKAIDAASKFMTPTVFKIVWSGIFIFSSVFGLFALPFFTWAAIKLTTEAQIDYMKLVEIYGLALVIDVIQKIIRTWLVYWKENMIVTVSPTFFLDHPDYTNKRDLFLTLIDPIDFWWLAVVSLGVARVAKLRYGPAALITFSVWFVLRIVFTAMSKTQ